MKKIIFALLLCLSISIYSRAQTKVFKEVSEGISSQVKAIWQDGALVGYLLFTQLEQASADSFNYRISIMDENLNDIGAIDFREQKLSLQAVAFDQDVLCLAYLKSNFINIEYKNRKEYRTAADNAKAFVLTQFLSLNGKIIKANSIKADVKITPERPGNGSKIIGEGSLKQSIQLRNIPQKGFACFFGDDTKNVLLTFNPAGKLTWQKVVKEDAIGFDMLTSNQDIYILSKKKDQMLEGGYELLGYNTLDSTTIPKYILKDKQGNSLKVLSFANDPSTGKPYITGNIISSTRGNSVLNANQLARCPYTGVFTIDFTDHKKGGIHEKFSYWADGSQSSISKKGRLVEDRAFVRYETSFKDYQGNTYFAGSSVIKRIKWVSVGFAVVTAPLIIPSLGILGVFGTQKDKLKNAVLIKQNAKGELSVENSIPANPIGFVRGVVPFFMYDTRQFYSVSNSDNKTNYLILDDAKTFTIYNVAQKKVARTIPHKDGNTFTSIFAAKEGHIMVSEYNKKEKSTSLSIEAL